MTPWKCEVCEQEEGNRESWARCVHCSLIRGTWVCRWCGRKQCETSKACRACGMKKGTAPPER